MVAIHRHGPHRYVTRLRAALLLVLALNGCTSGQPSGSEGNSLITHRDLGGGPAAQIEVTIDRDGECLVGRVSDPGATWLLIWPEHYTMQAQEIVDQFGNVMTSVGTMAKLAGGEYHDTQFAAVQGLLVSGQFPDACRRPEYWLVTAVH